MNKPSSSAAAPRAPKLSVRYGGIAKAMFRTLVVATLVLTGPFACWDWTYFMCMDDYEYTFLNASSDDCMVTPYFRSSDDTVDHLVVHGLQRGRFGIDAGQERVLRLETGDFRFSGAALECASDNAIRLVAGEALHNSTHHNVILHPAALYPVAPPEVVALSSRVDTWWPRARRLLFFVLFFSFPFVLFSAGRALRRAEELAVDEAIGLKITRENPHL